VIWGEKPDQGTAEGAEPFPGGTCPIVRGVPANDQRHRKRQIRSVAPAGVQSGEAFAHYGGSAVHPGLKERGVPSVRFSCGSADGCDTFGDRRDHAEAKRMQPENPRNSPRRGSLSSSKRRGKIWPAVTGMAAGVSARVARLADGHPQRSAAGRAGRGMERVGRGPSGSRPGEKREPAGATAWLLFSSSDYSSGNTNTSDNLSFRSSAATSKR